MWVAYGFRDTYSEGFGGKSQTIAQLLRIHMRFWCNESSEKTSNKREFHNHEADIPEVYLARLERGVSGPDAVAWRRLG